MREIYAGQSKYAWTCFIISSFVLTSLVDSQPSRITETPASDVTSSQWQTTGATFNQGQTTTATLDQGQKTTATLDQGQKTTATLDQGQKTTATLDQGQKTTATLDQGQKTTATLDQGQKTTATLDQGQKTTATLDQGQKTTATLDQGQKTTATLDQGQKTTATFDQGQTIKVIPERKTTVVWQHFPFVTSENGGYGSSSVNLITNTKGLYSNEDKLSTDDGNQKSDDDDISNREKRNNTEDNDINDLHSSGEAYYNNNINKNNTSNNSSNSNHKNSNVLHSKMYNCSSEDCIHSFHLHDLKKRSSYNNDDNSNTTSHDNRNDNGDFYFYDNYNYNKVTTDIYNVSIIDGKTNNHTISVKPTTSTSSTSSVLSELEEIYYSLLWYSTLVIQPILGLLGLTGNILSGIVATRSGLNKATNIFILALALADFISLIHCINVASMLRFFPKYYPWYYQIWEYPPSLAYFCFILTILTDFVLRLSGYFISGYICTLITLERVLAVYFPLRFKSIMTPRRAWILVVSTFLFWTSWVVTLVAMYDHLQIYYIPSLNIHVSYILSKSTTNFLVDMDAYFLTPMSKFFPVIVTVAGSILIGVKVRDAGRKRKTMTSVSKKSGSGSRTTKTLMLVCGVFIVSQCVVLPAFVCQYVLKEDIYMLFFNTLYSIIQSINGSCNFIIYVVFNKKFRAELKRLFSSCSKVLQNHSGTRSTSCTTTSQFQ